MTNTALLESIDFEINDNTNRYYNQEGKSVPRVTEILGCFNKDDRLMMWANHLGFRGIKYRDELNRAASVGEAAHKHIEMYLKEKIQANNIPFQGYLMWENVLAEKGIYVEPIYVEEKLECQWFGGTTDAVLRVNNRVFDVDFKSSNHITYKYFLQLAAYRYMLEHTHHIHIDGVIILQLDKKVPGFNEYLLDFNNPAHLQFIKECEQAFFALVYAYYHMTYAEQQYKLIF